MNRTNKQRLNCSLIRRLQPLDTIPPFSIDCNDNYSEADFLIPLVVGFFITHHFHREPNAFIKQHFFLIYYLLSLYLIQREMIFHFPFLLVIEVGRRAMPFCKAYEVDM